jgi:hypothetical protein
MPELRRPGSQPKLRLEGSKQLQLRLLGRKPRQLQRKIEELSLRCPELIPQVRGPV